jgi:hypothetical protein
MADYRNLKIHSVKFLSDISFQYVCKWYEENNILNLISKSKMVLCNCSHTGSANAPEVVILNRSPWSELRITVFTGHKANNTAQTHGVLLLSQTSSTNNSCKVMISTKPTYRFLTSWFEQVTYIACKMLGNKRDRSSCENSRGKPVLYKVFLL